MTIKTNGTMSEEVRGMVEAWGDTYIRKDKSDMTHPCKGIHLGGGNFSGCTGLGGDCPVCGK